MCLIILLCQNNISQIHSKQHYVTNSQQILRQQYFTYLTQILPKHNIISPIHNKFYSIINISQFIWNNDMSQIRDKFYWNNNIPSIWNKFNWNNIGNLTCLPHLIHNLFNHRTLRTSPD